MTQKLANKICKILLKFSFSIFIFASRFNAAIALTSLDNFYAATWGEEQPQGERKSD